MTLRSALEIATITDAGVVRAFNEDTVATEPDLGLVLVADGMGGYKAGDVASGLVASIMVEELKRRFPEGAPDTDQVLRDMVQKANQAVYRAAQASPQYEGMGSTVVVALFLDNHVHFTHVGDSRLYLVRGGKLKALTQDHSVLREQVALGMISTEDAKASHNRNLVTRALGMEPTVEFVVSEQRAEPGDVFLLCSDGLNDMVDDADIELGVSLLEVNLPLAARQLVMMANDNGGHDNVSAVLVKVLKPFPAEEPAKGLFGKLFGWFN